MKKLQSYSQSKQTYCLAFHQILWIFVMNNDLQSEKKQMIREIYGHTNIGFDPIVTNMKELKGLLTNISDKKLIKLVVSEESLKEVVRVTKNIDSIIEIHFYNPHNIDLAFIFRKKHQDQQQEDHNKDKYYKKKLVSKTDDLNNLIVQAKKEVEYGIKTFRSFQNGVILGGDHSQQEANRHRFRLLACKMMKGSDLEEAFDQLERYRQKELPKLNSQIKGQHSYSLQEVSQYCQRARKFLDQKQVTTQIKEQFYLKVLEIYQQQSFFYPLINNNLRSIKEKASTTWRTISLPFKHMYQAIHYFFQQNINRQNQDQSISKFYTSQFTVFRGGLIRKSQLKDLYKNQKKGVFLELLGFTSTSLSAKTAIDHILNKGKSKDQEQVRNPEQEDESCIFKIKCKGDKNILQDKYKYLNHGFYKFTDQKEKEVLFNTLNVFKLISVKYVNEARQLMNDEQLLQISKIKDMKYDNSKMLYYKKILVIELEYGNFHQVATQKNKFNLTQAEQKAKLNYIYCINKIYTCPQFDFGNAYELTNEIQNAENYYKKKIEKQNEDNFDICKRDNKNYFNRLISIHQKQGRVKDALKAAQISIKCYKYLQKIDQTSLCNNHFDTLLTMQRRIIKILRQSGDYVQTSIKLKQQLMFVRSQKLQESKKNLLQSQIVINQAINSFSLGRIQQCLSKFGQSKEIINTTLQKFKKTYILDVTWSDYYNNLFTDNWIFCYCTYIQVQRSRRIAKYEKQRINPQQLLSVKKTANNLTHLALKVLKNQQKSFKSQSQYQKLIYCFSQMLKNMNAQNQQQEIKKKSIQDEMKDLILKTIKVDPYGQQYQNTLQELKIKYKQAKKQEYLSIKTGPKSQINQTVIKFIEEERQKRLEDLRKQRVKNSSNALALIYQKESLQIEEGIKQLLKQGYSEHTLQVMQKHNQKADLLRECKQYEKALEQINFIENNILKDNQNREYELAMAFMTKGKIYFQQEKYQKAVQQLNKAQQYINQINYKNKRMEDLKGILAQPKEQEGEADSRRQLEPQQNVKQSQYKMLRHNNSHIELKLLKAKAILFWLNEIQTQNKDPWSSTDQKLDKLNKSPFQLKEEVDEIVTSVNDVLNLKQQIEDVNQLYCELLQVRAFLALTQCKQDFNKIFDLFKDCIKMRQNKFGKQNQTNALMCCHILFKYDKNQNVISHFLSFEFDRVIKECKQDLSNYQNSNYAEMMDKAQYIIKIQKRFTNQKDVLQHVESQIQKFLEDEQKTKGLNSNEQKQLEILYSMIKKDSKRTHESDIKSRKTFSKPDKQRENNYKKDLSHPLKATYNNTLNKFKKERNHNTSNLKINISEASLYTQAQKSVQEQQKSSWLAPVRETNRTMASSLEKSNDKKSPYQIATKSKSRYK